MTLIPWKALPFPGFAVWMVWTLMTILTNYQFLVGLLRQIYYPDLQMPLVRIPFRTSMAFVKLFQVVRRSQSNWGPLRNAPQAPCCLNLHSPSMELESTHPYLLGGVKWSEFFHGNAPGRCLIVYRHACGTWIQHQEVFSVYLVSWLSGENPSKHVLCCSGVRLLSPLGGVYSGTRMDTNWAFREA